jgi:hypothetical protein
VDTSARTIIEQNIKYYQNLLKIGIDTAMRENIARLLAEEEAKLTNLLEKGRKDKAP